MNRSLISLIAGFALAAAAPAQAHTDESDADVASLPAETHSVELPMQQLTPEILYGVILGEIAGARGRFDVAIEAYIRLAQQTRDPRIARRATEIALFARNLPAAAETARLWADSDPASDDARQVLAGVLASSGAQINDVQFQLARILAENPENLERNLLSLSQALAPMPDKEMARDIIERLTIPYLDHAAAHFARAQAAIATSNRDTALAEISRAVELDPDWEPAVLFKTQLLAQTDEIDQAQRLLEVYLHRQPDSRAARHAYARILILQQRHQEALLEFRYLLDATPDDPDLIYAVAVLSAQTDDLETATRLFKRALQAGYRETGAVYLQLGQAAEQQQDSDDALQWYRSVPPGQHYLAAQARIAAILARQGKIDEARALLHNASDNDEERRDLLLTEVTLLRDNGHAREAMTLLDEALAHSPNDTDLLYESAMVAEKLQRINVVESRLRRVIALEPDNAHAYNALGYTFAELGERLEEAESLIATALELMPGDPYILDSMGWVRFRRGDAHTALMFLQQAYETHPEAEIAAHLSEVLWSLERYDEARQILTASLLEFPDNKILRETAERLGVK